MTSLVNNKLLTSVVEEDKHTFFKFGLVLISPAQLVQLNFFFYKQKVQLNS